MTQRQIAVRTDNARNLGVILAAIEADPNLEDSTRAQYKRAITRAVEAGVNLVDAAELARYAQTVSDSERAFLRAGLARLVEAERQAMGNVADPNAANVVELEARMSQVSRKLEAILSAVPTPDGDDGQSEHTWLSQREVRALLSACDRSTLKGQRDHLALALMVGAGLRRNEAAELEFDNVSRKPVNGRLRWVLHVRGKGKKRREIPISDALGQAIECWAERLGAREGRVLRSLDRWGNVNGSVSTDALYKLTKQRGAEIGKPNLQPHDLRRTYAQIGYEAGVSIAQIGRLLGHARIETTMTYLSIETNYQDTISDYVPV
jgi:integrase